MESEFKINKRGVGKTLKKWASLGFVPKRGRKGELRYGNRGDIAKGKAPQLYFDPEDVKEDKKAAMDLYNKIEQEEHPSLNQRGRTLHQWLEAGFIPKRGCKGHLRYPSYASNCRDEEYLYFDPEEVVNGLIEESPHAQKVIEKESNRRWNTTGKTLDQWLNLGFVPKRGAKPTERFTSYRAYRRYGTTCYYYDPNQVREDKNRAIQLKKKIKDTKRREREAERREKEERQRIAEEFRESRCTRYQWARVGRVANKGAKFEWGSRLNQAIKDEDVYQFGNRYMYCHISDTHDANADEMSAWEEFFEYEKRGVGFTAIRSRLIDLCPEYQPFRRSLLASWEREQFDTWWE